LKYLAVFRRRGKKPKEHDEGEKKTNQKKRKKKEKTKEKDPSKTRQPIKLR